MSLLNVLCTQSVCAFETDEPVLCRSVRSRMSFLLVCPVSPGGVRRVCVCTGKTACGNAYPYYVAFYSVASVGIQVCMSSCPSGCVCKRDR